MVYDIYLKNSRIPKLYLNDITLYASPEDLESFKRLKSIQNDIKSFVDSGDCLLICSNFTGNGKTTWATKLMKSYMKEVSNLAFSDNMPCLFINVNNFISKAKQAISDPDMKEEFVFLKKKILETKLVVFDEIGVKNLTDYELSLLYDLIDTRISDIKSCIFTSNQLPYDLSRTLDGRLYSRVVKHSEIVEFKSRKDNR